MLTTIGRCRLVLTQLVNDSRVIRPHVGDKSVENERPSTSQGAD